MSYFLNVPVIAQTSSNTCWHASAMMIWRYWQGVSGRKGPMNTMSDKFDSDSAATPEDFVRLAEKTGMKAVDPMPSQFDTETVQRLLQQHGPLWCAGKWYGLNHIIVLTGINNNTIFINDPDGGMTKNARLDWFALKLDEEVQGSLMYKDPNKY